MNVNFNSSLKGPDGLDISDEKSGEPITLCTIASQALLSSFEGDQPDGAEKHARYKLWRKIRDSGDVDVDAEEIAKMKSLIGIGWAPMISGQCWDLLEGRQFN